MGLKLQTIICSTRPGRIGPVLGHWFHQFAEQHSDFDCELVDLADFNLPVYDEPNHPRAQDYQHAHTQAWSKKVAAADAYVFVLPEYNYCPPPSFFNALNYLYNEWNYKACGFLSYGGVSGGLRSAQIAKQLVATLKMMAIPEGVTVQMPWEHFSEENGNKVFAAQEPHKSSSEAMLKELHKWTQGLQHIK